MVRSLGGSVWRNVVLNGYGKVEKYEKMEKVLSGMLKNKECKPDVWTMHVILTEFGNKGQIDMTERWYEKLRNFGIEPKMHLQYLDWSLWKEEDACQDVVRDGLHEKATVPTDDINLQHCYQAFADVDDAQNMEYSFDQMRAEGMQADRDVLLLIRFTPMRAYSIRLFSVQLTERFNIPENTTLYNVEISACGKAEDLMEMENVQADERKALSAELHHILCNDQGL